MSVYLYSLSFTALFSLLLGLFVIYKNPFNRVNQTWGLSTILCSIWSLFSVLEYTAPDFNKAILYTKILNVAAAYMCVSVAHFCMEVTEFRSKSNKALVSLGYASSVLITIFAFTPYFCSASPFLRFNYFTETRPLYHYFTLHFCFYVIYTERLLLKSIRTAPEPKKNQIKYVLIGLTLGYLGGFGAFLTAYRLPIETYLSNFVWLYAAIITYAILKHRLMDIQVVIKRTLIYSAVTVLISLAYVAMVVILNQMFSSSPAISLKSFSGINLFAFTSFLCGLASLILLIFAMMISKTKSQRLFAWLNVAVVFWSFGNFAAGIFQDKNDALIAWDIAFAAVPFTQALFNHLIRSSFDIRKKWILIGSYLYAGLFCLIGIFRAHWLFGQSVELFHVHYYRAKPLLVCSIALYSFFIISAFYELTVFLKKAPIDQKMQIRYFIFGFGFGFLGGMSTLLPFLGVYSIYPIGNIGVFIYVCILAYAISAHQLMDIQIVIKRTIFYSILAIGLSTFYVLVIFAIHRFFIFGDPSKSTLLGSIVLIVAITLLLKPIEAFLHRTLDKKFFKGTITEIAEQKQLLETELERRERLKSVGILAAGMAHEIKNPITSIKTFTQYLPEKHNDPEFLDKFYRIVNQETDRISAIVKDLLMFSKPSEPNRRSCDLRLLLKDILDLLSSDMIKKGIRVEFDADQSSYNALIDNHQVKQAFLNIVMNAADAMSAKGGFLRVQLARGDDFIESQIIDTGCGIPQDKIRHIFDPFYTAKEDGTGLGLAVTHSMIEKNGGSIQVMSEEGRGTTFVIKLPRAS